MVYFPDKGTDIMTKDEYVYTFCYVITKNYEQQTCHPL